MQENDTEYHEDQQGIRTNSAIRALRNSAITLDLASEIYGDVIAGRGIEVDENANDKPAGGEITIKSIDGGTFKGDYLAGNDGKIDLAPEELLITTTQKEGFVSQEDRGVTVVLDTNLTPELIEEGFVREIISKIQTMRKEAGFEVTDHIVVCESGNDKIRGIMADNADVIKRDVLAEEVEFDTERGYSKEWNINGEHVKLSVEKR